MRDKKNNIASTLIASTPGLTFHTHLLQQQSSVGGKKGHSRGKRRKGPQPDNECCYCHQKGHWVSKCLKREEDKKTKKASSSANVAVNQLVSLGRCKVSQVYVATSEGSGYLHMLLDCAATCHMFAEKEFFKEYTHVTHKYITVGGNNCMDVTGIGSVVFKVKLGGRRSSVILKSTLHIPILGANLVSLGTLQCEGATVGSYEEGLLI
jgi:hypothetical protein